MADGAAVQRNSMVFGFAENKPLIIVANKDDLPDFTAAFSPVTEWLENECILSSEQLCCLGSISPR